MVNKAVLCCSDKVSFIFHSVCVTGCVCAAIKCQLTAWSCSALLCSLLLPCARGKLNCNWYVQILRVWFLVTSETWQHVVWQLVTDIAKAPVFSVFRSLKQPTNIQDDSEGICTTLGCYSMSDSKQKSSYEHGSDFERLQSYDRSNLGTEGNDYWQWTEENNKPA